LLLDVFMSFFIIFPSFFVCVFWWIFEVCNLLLHTPRIFVLFSIFIHIISYCIGM
jgi:hypothetical protein